MKKTLLLSTILSVSMAVVAFAADKLEGKATCAKCDLGTSDKCRAAVVVKGADGKEVVYLSEANDQSKKLHSEICKGGKDGTIEGTVNATTKTITIDKYTLK